MTNILHSRAMLSNLSITGWSARKLDKRITHETNEAHGASANAGRYNKALIAGKALAEIVSIGAAARLYHYSNTLAWGEINLRLLPVLQFTEYSNRMRQYREAYEAAVNDFCGDFPSFVEQARVDLNGMFNAADYPPVERIRAKFNFAVELSPIPDSADFRIDMAGEELERIKSQYEKFANDRIADATREVYGRIAETVGHMAAKLAEFRPAVGASKAAGVFRDSLVENVRNLVALLPALNVTADSKLAALTRRMERELIGHDAETLRDSPAVRAAVQQSAAEIVAAVSEYI